MNVRNMPHGSDFEALWWPWNKKPPVGWRVAPDQMISHHHHYGVMLIRDVPRYPLCYIRPGDGCVEIVIKQGDEMVVAKLSPELARLKAEDLLRIARKAEQA